MPMKERQRGPDLLRALAAALVVATHALTITGVMDRNVGSPWFLPLVAVRYLALTCVPLFLLLTGYFSAEKKLSRGYFAGILPVLLSYTVIAVGCLAGKGLISGDFGTVQSNLYAFFSFTADPYGWYVEMYIGLFLLIPFLNLIHQSLDKRGLLTLIGVLLCLTALPPVAKSFLLDGRWAAVLPDFFELLYPVTYYFIGVYFRRYQPTVPLAGRAGRFFVGLGVALAAIALPSVWCFVLSRMKGEYAWYLFNGSEDLTTVAAACALFLWLYQVKPPKWLGLAASEVARCSLELYLVSAIFDELLYARLNIPWPLVTLCVFVCSYLAARVLRLALVPLSGWLMKLLKGEKKA